MSVRQERIRLGLEKVMSGYVWRSMDISYQLRLLLFVWDRDCVIESICVKNVSLCLIIFTPKRLYHIALFFCLVVAFTKPPHFLHSENGRSTTLSHVI
jgi:hypothetical protein